MFCNVQTTDLTFVSEIRDIQSTDTALRVIPNSKWNYISHFSVLIYFEKQHKGVRWEGKRVHEFFFWGGLLRVRSSSGGDEGGWRTQSDANHYAINLESDCRLFGGCFYWFDWLLCFFGFCWFLLVASGLWSCLCPCSLLLAWLSRGVYLHLILIYTRARNPYLMGGI